ncbi:MAG: hypothetical protein ABSD44_11745 [Terracidiphilus sp.]|jgi:hypothetical protein
MMPAIVPYRDALTLIIAGLSISLTMFFGHFKTWRHRICFEYDSKQSAAVTALRDKFKEEAEQHFRAIQQHLRRTGGTVQQFYAESKQRTLIKTLALRLERCNEIIRLYSYLTLVSQVVEVGLLVESAILILSIGTIWVPIGHYGVLCLVAVLLGILAILVVLMFTLLYLEARFLTATNGALRPEFD